MDPLVKNVLVWTVIIAAVLLLYQFLLPASAGADLMDSDRFSEALKGGRVAEVSLPKEATIDGTLNENGADGKPARFLVATPPYRDLVDSLLKRNVRVRYLAVQDSRLKTTLLSWVPLIAVVVLWIFFMRAMRAGQTAGRQGGPGRAVAD
jgi:ATP-dependent Zn protease